MVAFSGPDPIGVLIGAKRSTGTLIHKIAVHPEHRRAGHGSHLLTSLSSKLAILGPPRIVAEVPETLAPACGLFGASGFVEEAVLTDYVLDGKSSQVQDEANGGSAIVIPVTVEDLEANGLLGEMYQQTCWERTVDTLKARKGELEGLAVASDERLEAYILWIKHEAEIEIVSLRSFIEDGGVRLKQLLSRLGTGGMGTFRFAKVHPSEISSDLLEALGFRAAGGHRLYAAKARSV
jgi:hypothetical protein